jgi:hypothetical protein
MMLAALVAHLLAGQIDPGDLCHQHAGVLLPPQHAANRDGNVGRVQGGGRDLVEERLEGVVVLAIE